MLTKEQILSANDCELTKVSIPEWGGDVYLKPMTGKDKNSYEQSLITENGNANIENIYAKVLVRCIVDQDCKRLFLDSEADELGNKSAAVLSRLMPVAQKISGMRGEDIEDARKN